MRAVIVTMISAVIAIVSALGMREHVRLVEIVTLFASGVGTGAGIAATVAARRRQAEEHHG